MNPGLVMVVENGPCDEALILRAGDNMRSPYIVAFTLSCESADIDRTHEMGCNAFVTKPDSCELHIDAVAMLAPFWLRLDLPPVQRRAA